MLCTLGKIIAVKHYIELQKVNSEQQRHIKYLQTLFFGESGKAHIYPR